MAVQTRKVSLTPTSQALLILAVSALGIHLGGNALKMFMLQRPDLQVLQRDPPAQAVAIKSGAINVIQEEKTKAPVVLVTGQLPSDLPNKIFTTGEKSMGQASGANSEADLFSQLPAHLRLDAITHNGVILNGKFVGFGEPIDGFAYPAPGGDATNPDTFIAARVIEAKKGMVIIREPIPPHRTLRLGLD